MIDNEKIAWNVWRISLIPSSKILASWQSKQLKTFIIIVISYICFLNQQIMKLISFLWTVITFRERLKSLKSLLLYFFLFFIAIKSFLFYTHILYHEIIFNSIIKSFFIYFGEVTLFSEKVTLYYSRSTNSRRKGLFVSLIEPQRDCGITVLLTAIYTIYGASALISLLHFYNNESSRYTLFWGSPLLCSYAHLQGKLDCFEVGIMV